MNNRQFILQEKQFLSEFNKILNNWDFIGVLPFEGGPKDEYDCLIPPILGLLNKGTKEEEVASLLNKKLEDHFGLNPKLYYTGKIAREILGWWNIRKNMKRT